MESRHTAEGGEGCGVGGQDLSQGLGGGEANDGRKGGDVLELHFDGLRVVA